MKCPYIRKSEITQSIEKTNSDDETGVYDKRTTFEMADCLKENCAKWQDGKCAR